MIDIRPFNSLGHADHGWLDARHHFSFAKYHDPSRMCWGRIRVWNDDKIGAKSGFPPHPHRDMEIITYVRSGAITHQDSMGNKGRTEAGDVQVMSAGTGVQHAEYNLEDEQTTLFQIWVQTDAEFQSFEYASVVGSGDPVGLNTGAENRDGSSGVNLGSVPASGDAYHIETSPPAAGGTATITYDAIGQNAGTTRLKAKMTSDVTQGTAFAYVTMTVG